MVDLGLRLDDIEGLEREPAAATKTSASMLREQLAENGATTSEIDILLNERVELNAMASDALIEMIERKLKAYGLKKVIPDDDLLAETYRAFRRSERLREKFEEMEDGVRRRGRRRSRFRETCRNGFARSSTSTTICGGTTLSGSCSIKRSSTACERRSKRPKRSPATSRAPAKTRSAKGNDASDARSLSLALYWQWPYARRHRQGVLPTSSWGSPWRMSAGTATSIIFGSGRRRLAISAA